MPSVSEVQDSIIAYLNNDTRIPNVWEEVVPAGVELPREQDVFLPYVLISFGGQAPVRQDQQGIVSSALDLKWTSVGIECIGQYPKHKRDLAGVVRELLEGYVPGPGWGQLREQLSDSYTVKVPDFSLWPVRFATGITYNVQDNAITSN